MEEDCSIASVDAEVGENVRSGSQIFYATCGDDLEVQLNIPETVIARIQKGMKVQVRFSALTGKTFEGQVTDDAIDGGDHLIVR